MVEASFSVNGLKCEIGCKKIIEDKLNSLSGVQNAEVLFAKKIVKVKYDIQFLNEKEIIEAVESLSLGTNYKILDYTILEIVTLESKNLKPVSASTKVKKEPEYLPNRITFPNIFKLFFAR